MENNTQKKTQTSAIVALVCGIVSIVACWIPYFNLVSLILGIVGIVFGVKGRKEAPAGKTGMATAGMVCSIIGTALSAIGFISCTLCVVCFGTAVVNSAYYW